MLVNITPHVINIILPNGEMINLPPSGTVARVATTIAERGGLPLLHEGIVVPVTWTTFGEVIDLPEPKEGVTFVASLLVAQAATRLGRWDVLSPGPLVRDAGGQPVGCQGLSAPG